MHAAWRQSGIDRGRRTVSHRGIVHFASKGEDQPAMSIKGKANIVGIFEHPTRKADDKSLFQLHAECAQGALADAGLGKNDIDGYFCAAGDTPGLGALSMIDYLGLKLRHWDSTDTGGSSYLLQVGHAAEAIALGKCSIALITQQSSRCNGSAIIGEFTTSSTVTTSRSIACGLCWAWCEAATLIQASCSLVVPYWCMWRIAHIAYMFAVAGP